MLNVYSLCFYVFYFRKIIGDMFVRTRQYSNNTACIDFITCSLSTICMTKECTNESHQENRTVLFCIVIIVRNLFSKEFNTSYSYSTVWTSCFVYVYIDSFMFTSYVANGYPRVRSAYLFLLY